MTRFSKFHIGHKLVVVPHSRGARRYLLHYRHLKHGLRRFKHLAYITHAHYRKPRMPLLDTPKPQKSALPKADTSQLKQELPQNQDQLQ